MKRSALTVRTASLHLLGAGWLEIAGGRELDLARAHYQRLERDLRTELGLEPLVETTALMLELQPKGARSQQRFRRASGRTF